MPMHKCSAASTLLLTRLLVQAGILGMPNGAFLYADQLNEVLTAKSEQGGFKDLVRGPCCPLNICATVFPPHVLVSQTAWPLRLRSQAAVHHTATDCQVRAAPWRALATHVITAVRTDFDLFHSAHLAGMCCVQ